LAATLLLVPAAPSVWGSDGDSPALPVLDCGVRFAEGTFFGYSPPKAGDRLHLDLGRITGTTLDRLQFLPDSHIPLVRPLKVIKETRDGEGRLQAMRLRSEPNEDWMLTIDVQSYRRAGAPMTEVWILHEQPLMASIAVLDCRSEVTTGGQ
jgi:hypothetical protein